jgi:hypothetical protein
MAMVSMTQVRPLEDATDLLGDPAALRARAEGDGALFFRGLLDSDSVLSVRRQILEVCASHGWVNPGSDPMEGIVNPDVVVGESQDPRWRAFYANVQKLRDFHALALHSAIIGVLEVLFGESVLPHSRNICRLVFPGSEKFSTPPHQDNLYIGGSQETWTVWVPGGDCPVALGGLAFATGTHTAGQLATKAAVGPGGSQVNVDEETAWMGGDYLTGDAVFLHSLAIHQGRDNDSSNLLRVSCDYRYQPRSHPVREDSLLPHMGWQSWEEIYSDWDQDDPTKYYWNDWNLDVVAKG